MQDRTLATNDTGTDAGKARWHAPTLKRLDVDLTAGNRRNSNDPPVGQSHHLNS
jgi:hypothetical protein